MKARARRKKLKEAALSKPAFKCLGFSAILLVPWTIWLSYSLPPNHLDSHWDIAWSGFDVGLLIALALTAYLGHRRSGWVTITGSITGSLLVVDAWFDSLTAKTQWEHLVSLTSAVLIELPLAFISFWIAYETGKRFFNRR